LPEAILGTVSQESNLQAEFENKLSLNPQNIITKLSFSHIVELIKIEEIVNKYKTFKEEFESKNISILSFSKKVLEKCN